MRIDFLWCRKVQNTFLTTVPTKSRDPDSFVGKNRRKLSPKAIFLIWNFILVFFLVSCNSKQQEVSPPAQGASGMPKVQLPAQVDLSAETKLGGARIEQRNSAIAAPWSVEVPPAETKVETQAEAVNAAQSMVQEVQAQAKPQETQVYTLTGQGPEVIPEEVSAETKATLPAEMPEPVTPASEEMEKIITESAPIFATAVVSEAPSKASAPAAKELVVYLDKAHRGNHYIPSGLMGDYGDIQMNDNYANNPHSGKTCIEFIYTAKKSQGKGWAGVYWQNPMNNWGTKKGGFDLSGMTKLTFWAKGAKGKEVIQKIVVGGINGEYSDSAAIETGPIELTDTWKEYTVNLAGKDLSYISGGFSWVTTADLNSQGCTFYIDDIKFAADLEVKPEGKEQQEMPFSIYSDKGAISNHFIASGWMGDYSDLKYDEASTELPYAGKTCIKIVYNNKASQGARWAGIYWQNPANNWGSVNSGFDLSKAAKVTFWARGENGGEQFAEFKIGGITGEYSDSDTASVGPITLTKEWKQYTIDLAGKDLSFIIGGFCFSTNIDINPQGITFYLDEIKYE